MKLIETFEIVIDSSSLFEASGGLVGGKIHFHLAMQSFPEETWFDFPVPVLGWWIQSARLLLEGQTREAMLPFMDGPFRVKLSAEPSGLWIARGLEDRISGIAATAEIVFSPVAFVGGLINAATGVGEWCRWQNVSSPAVDEMRDQLTRMANRQPEQHQ